MSTITREFTKEQLQQIIENDHVQCGEASALARIALASLEAEPVAWIVHARTGDQLTADGGYVANAEGILGLHSTPLYTAPPALASVPDERAAFNAWNNDTDCPLAGRNAKTAAWLAWSRRAAMLQGVDGNSPAIPDGYALVPVEPTENMIVNGFESEPDESFSDEKEWEAYDAMSGCQQAAHRAKLCWAAMIEAAPKLKHDLT